MRPQLLLLILLSLLGTACSTPQLLIDRKKLMSDPDWLIVRAIAQKEVERNEGRLGWNLVLSEKESGALYPTLQEDSIWTVIACADYPENTMGYVVEMKISTHVGLLRYFQRWKAAR